MAITGNNAQEFPKAFSLTQPLPLDGRQIHDSYEAAVAWVNDATSAAFEQRIITAMVNGSPKMYILKKHVSTGEGDTIRFDLIDITTTGEAQLDWETF